MRPTFEVLQVLSHLLLLVSVNAINNNGTIKCNRNRKSFGSHIIEPFNCFIILSFYCAINQSVHQIIILNNNDNNSFVLFICFVCSWYNHQKLLKSSNTKKRFELNQRANVWYCADIQFICC